MPDGRMTPVASIVGAPLMRVTAQSVRNTTCNHYCAYANTGIASMKADADAQSVFRESTQDPSDELPLDEVTT
jgi:hypothetical protein